MCIRDSSYLAPEQVDGDRADARSDVYAAGLLMYELLTGQRAFHGDNPAHVMYQHCLLYTSPSPRDRTRSRMPSSA